MAIVFHNHFSTEEDAANVKSSMHNALRGSSAYVDSQVAICDGNTDDDFYLIVGESGEGEYSTDLYLYNIAEPTDEHPGAEVIRKLIRLMDIQGPITHHMLARVALVYAIRELFYFPDCEDIDTPLGAAYLIGQGVVKRQQGYLIRRSEIDLALFPQKADRDFAMLIADCYNDIEAFLEEHVIYVHDPWDAVNSLTREDIANLADYLWGRQEQALHRTHMFKS